MGTNLGEKKHKEQLIISYVSTNHGPPLTCFLGGWYSELDAKAEEQKQKSNVQTALKKLIVFTVFNGFANEEDALPKVAHLAHSPDPLF